MLVDDLDNHRIQVFDEQTCEHLRNLGVGRVRRPLGIALSPSERYVYVCEWEANRVACIDLVNDETASSWPAAPKSSTTEDGMFHHPYGVAVLPNGNVFISDDNYRVQVFQ